MYAVAAILVIFLICISLNLLTLKIFDFQYAVACFGEVMKYSGKYYHGPQPMPVW